MGHHLSRFSNADKRNNNNNNSSSDNNSSNHNDNNSNACNQGRGYPANRRRHKQLHKKIRKELTDSELQRLTDDVLDLIHTWFPDLHNLTYFLPPVHLNKVPYESRTVGGREVKEVLKTPESDWRDDEVMQRTLWCIRALTQRRQEAMVVIQQLQHDNYLDKPCYYAAASMYPRPCDLDVKLRRGDFDILFLNRQRGIVVAEIKSVGWRPGGEQDDAAVKKKVGQGLEQLKKAESVLRHLVSDLQPAPRVTKTLILPNVSSDRLQRILAHDSQLAQEFCNCFHVPDIHFALSLCLCSEKMTSIANPSDVTDAILNKLIDWWSHLVPVALRGWDNFAPNTSDEEKEDLAAATYELVVARFCGPATTVQVHCVKPPRLLEFRTLGHAVQDVGERMMKFVLFPEQLALLQELRPRVYLTGPPGTGKSLLLILVTLTWCRRGHVVHILSADTFSEAASHLLYYQVRTTLAETNPELADNVKLHVIPESHQNPVNHLLPLLQASCPVGEGAEEEEGGGEGGVYVVADEADVKFRQIFTELHNNVQGLHVWAGSYRSEHRPEGMEERRLSVCLRSTPVVQRRMQTAISFKNNNVYPFDDVRMDYLSPSEGPPEIYLSHLNHPTEHPLDCEQCGREIARCLLHTLQVGNSKPSAPRSLNTPPSLSFSDVIIIPDFYQNKDLYDDASPESSTDPQLPLETDATRSSDSQSLRVPDLSSQSQSDLAPSLGVNLSTESQLFTTGLSDGRKPPSTDLAPNSQSLGLVRGLRSSGVPTFVVKRGDGDSIGDLARGSREAVAVVEWGVCNGLERKVVVSVGQGRGMGDGVSGVLHGASRCVSQLIYVQCPENVLHAVGENSTLPS